jgi:hypothetical protein
MAEGEQQPSQDQQNGTWQYKPEGSTKPVSINSPNDDAPKAQTDNNAVEWTASEFIAHPKNLPWYAAFAAVIVAVTFILYILTHDVVTAVVVIILGIILGIIAARQPRIVGYRLDRSGLTIGKQFHSYGSFKSFAVVDEGVFASITLLPIRRFDLPLSIYFAPEDEHKIMNVLSKYLPLQQGSLDSIERLMRSLHF